MTQYLLIIPDDYDAWVAKTPEERAAVYARHEDFTARLTEGGHEVLGGAELTHPRTARTVRAGADGVVVTDGPYAEAVEQLSGYYLVESSDPQDLEVCAAIIAEHFPVEIRACGPAVADEGVVAS